jgi:hypothetical protein
MARDVIVGKSLERIAAQPDSYRFLKCLFFAPALVDDSQDHHEGADPIGAGASDQHGMIALISRQTQKLVGLLFLGRGTDDRNIEIAHLDAFDFGTLAREVQSFIGGAQA